MVNRYDNPAQAEFINTYIPIPFEQLYTLGKQAKEDVETSLKEYSAAMDKWSDFQSPSEVDTRAWYNETYGRFAPVADAMAKNPELIKDPMFRSKMYATLNNTDRAKLSMLRQSAAGMNERMKANQRLMLEGKYNPIWHDVDFTNYNTLDANTGIFNDVSPLAYQSIKDLTDKYVNNLKDSYLGRANGFINTGVTADQIRGILDANRTGILSTPEAQKHLQLYMQQTGASYEEAANAFMDRAFTDNREYIRNNVTVDPYAMQALREQQALRVAATRKGKGQDSKDYPDAYNKLYNETVYNEQQRLKNDPRLANTRRTMETAGSIIQDLVNASKELEAGAMNPNDYQAMYKAYMEQYSKLSSPENMSNAYTQDIREIFAQNAGNIFPEVGITADKKPAYYDASSRTLNQLMHRTSGTVMNLYNAQQSSSKVEINSGDAATNGYVIADTRGLELASDFVSKLMKVESPKYMVDTKDTSRWNQTKQSIQRNFSNDLQNGVFKDCIIVPRNDVMTSNVDGNPELVQRVTVKIPVQSILNAGYDQDSFKDMVKSDMGLTSEIGLNVKPVKSENIEDAWGTTSDRGGSALTGEYFSFDVIQKIDHTGFNRLGFDQLVEKEHGGSKLQTENYDANFSDTFSILFGGGY